jgi:hypothetical protein
MLHDNTDIKNKNLIHKNFLNYMHQVQNWQAHFL